MRSYTAGDRLRFRSRPQARRLVEMPPLDGGGDAVGYSRDMTHTRFASVAVLALVAITIPRPAAADIRLTGFGGVSFINDENKGTYGAAIAISFDGRLTPNALVPRMRT